MSEEAPTDEQSSGGGIPWSRLHPLSVAVNLVPRAWRVLRSAWPLLLAALWGAGSDRMGLIDMALLLTFFGLTVGSSIVHYLTLRYRVHEGRLEIESGLVNRQVRTIDPSRVQNVEIVRNLFQRAAGLVEVRIETASGTEIEGMLSALSEHDAEELVTALGEARQIAGEADDETEEGEVVVSNDLGDLVRYGATATRFGAGVLVVFGLFLEATQLLDPGQVEDVGGFVTGSGAFFVLLALLTGTWLVGTGTALLRHYGFRLLQRGGRLVAMEGLFTQRRVELPFHKIQLVSVREPWLRRLLGFGSMHIETAAAREQAGGTISAEAMVPVVRREQVDGLLHRALPGVREALWDLELRPPHPRALRRRMIGGGIRAAIFAALLSWWFYPWGLLALLLVPGALVTAWLDHRHQGWLVTDEVIVARQGYIDRRTEIVPRGKLQSLEVQQGPIQRRWGLGRLVLRVAGTTVALPDLGFEESVGILRKLAEGEHRRAVGE